MKKTVSFLFLLFICFGLQAQSIIEDLEAPVENQGTITIEADKLLNSVIGTPSSGKGNEGAGFEKMKGYRLQIFMGNSPRTAKNEALRKQALVNEQFPELATYVVYAAPNWKLFAGDFMTREEAQVYRQKMQKAFPDFGREVYMISDKINVSAANRTNNFE